MLKDIALNIGIQHGRRRGNNTVVEEHETILLLREHVGNHPQETIPSIRDHGKEIDDDV